MILTVIFHNVDTILYLSRLKMMLPILNKKIGYGWRQNQEAKLKIVGGDLPGSNQQDLDPTIHYVTSAMLP